MSENQDDGLNTSMSPGASSCGSNGTNPEVEIAELKEKNLRLLAEFDNFKKRSLKERSELLKYQGERVVVDLLEVIDNFERAMTAGEADATQFKAGVELIYKTFLDLLNRWEVRMQSGIGRPFDPAFQSALSAIPVPDMEPGVVVNELKKAVYYKDKLIRVGEVIVVASSEQSV